MDSEIIQSIFAKSQQDMREKDADGLYKVIRSYDVTVGQQREINKWLTEVIYPAAIAAQKAEYDSGEKPYDARFVAARMSWESGYPYAGAIGGDVTYQFTSTGLGDILVVSTPWSDETLNVTEFETW